VKDKALIEEHK